jgi:hypothetical protein
VRGSSSSARCAPLALWLTLALVATACGADDSAPARVKGAAAGSGIVSSAKRTATVWAVGDAANGDQESRDVARLIARGKPDRLLYLGDVYEHGTRQEYRENYAPVFGRFDHLTAPTPGNHEWDKRDEGYFPYWRGATGGSMPPYYAFSIAGWRLISLNSETAHDSGSPQLRWLRSQVRGARNTCRLAFWHRPRYSEGHHGDQEDVEPFWRALRGRAALVVNGHDHDMQRFRPRQGITELVAGAGGSHLYEVHRGNPQLAFGNGKDYGALRLRLRRGVARFSFVARSGRKLDSGSIHCEAR